MTKGGDEDLIVDVQNIHLAYQSPDGEVNALENIDFSIQEGEFVSLVGPSGCGKSTLLSIIAGLIPPTQGSVLVEGEAITAPSAKIGYMPQKDQLFPWRTIWDNVTLGLELRHQATAENKDRVRDLLERYGLKDFIKKTPNQLSGGMRQRCALIRTLALSPSILLLDEPFSALDYQTRLAVSTDIRDIIAQEGKTALLVTHDISESVTLSHRVLVLSHRPGRIKSTYDLVDLAAVPSSSRRDHPNFGRYFNLIWKELDVHG